MKKLGLLPRIAIAIVLGILIGFIAPQCLGELCATFNAIYGQFLGFMIPMIIIGFVVPAIGDIGARAGRLLVVTALLAYGFTVFAGLVSYTTGSIIFPGLIAGEAEVAVAESAGKLSPWFTVEMPPLMGVTTALVLSFLLGLGIAFSSGNALRKGMEEFRDIVSKTINTAILPLLPVYIFGIFLCMTVEGEVGMILKSFIKIIGIIFLLHVFVLVVQYCIAAPFARRNPFRMGGREDVAGFVIPLCATIHLSGSTLKIVACALAIMIMHNQPHDLPLFIHFVMMLGITMVAAPGIPGGAIMASLGVLQSILGFDQEAIALMIALYIAMDSFGTACNVTGDGAIAAIVDRVS